MFRVLYSYFKVKKQSINSNISDALIDSLPEGTTVESVVCLSREKADDYIRISVHTRDLQPKAN